MKKHFSKLIKHPLISGSSVVFVGWFIGSFLNYMFNLLMGRLLSVSDYGLLITLSSSFVLLGIFIGTFNSTFAKFIAVHHANKNKKGIDEIIVHGVKITVIFSILLFVILILLTPFISSILHTTNIWFLLLMYGAICFSILFSVPFGVLQGQMRFFLLSLANGSQAIVKLVFGITFVLLGMRVLGGLLGIFLSSLLPTVVILFYLLKPYRHKLDLSLFSEWTITKELSHYGAGFFMSTVGITLLSSTDIILVHYFFDATTAGQYAALSLMGKAIFYLVGPIGFVFFPLIVFKKEKNESTSSLLLLTIGLVSLFSLGLSFIYFVFPHLVLSIFFPSAAYKGLVAYLGIFSLYIFVFSLYSLFNSFFLSVGKTSVYKITLIAGILQTISILVFHSSMYQVIGILFLFSFLVLAILLIYYLKYINIMNIIKNKTALFFL